MPSGTRASPGPRTRSPTRSPTRTWCSASADAARTVRSRLLAAPSTPPAVPDVAQGVHHDEDPRVLLGPGGHDLQRAGAQRHRPADPAQPVPGAKPPDPAELGPAAHPARPVRPDQAVGLRRLGPGVVGRRLGQHRDGWSAGTARGPQRKPAQALVSATCSSPTGRRPQRRDADARLGHAVARGGRRRPRTAGESDDVRRTLQHAGHVLDPVGRLHDQRRWPVPCPSCSRLHPEVGDQAGRRARPVHQAQHRGHEEGRRQDHQHRRAEQRPPRPGPPPRRAHARPAPGVATQRVTVAPAAAPGSAGAGTLARTESTTRGPEAAVIHSSGSP